MNVRVGVPFVLFLALGLPGARLGAEDAAPAAEGPTPELRLASPQDAARVAKDLSIRRLGEGPWADALIAMRKKYDNWAEGRRHEGRDDDIGRYLNDQLVILAFRALGGRVEALQEGALWLSFYPSCRQPLPELVTDFLKRHQDSVNGVLGAFDWEKASAYVKAKQWKKDAEEKGRKP
ncbi:MAG: hypothetical protein M5U26_20560 [Planctomycetota bacterium]|nr:hypothetical protein [Planctomycetota bacterium]